MTAYYNIPTVMTKAKETYALWFKILTDFPKVHRYNLGGKIEEYFLGMLENIFQNHMINARKKFSDIAF